MNLLSYLSNPFKRPPPMSEVAELRDQNIALGSENLFLRSQGEAAGLLNAELIARCAVLEGQVHRLQRPRREPRKDKASVRDLRELRLSQLRATDKQRGQGK